MKIFIVYYEDDERYATLAKAFKTQEKAVSYCDEMQKFANDSNKGILYYYQSMDVED